MFLSEKEIGNRLSKLRRERDAIEREIADLLRFLELGRRLSDATPLGKNGLGQSEPRSGPQDILTDAKDFPARHSFRSGLVLSEDVTENAPEDSSINDVGRHEPDRGTAHAGSEHLPQTFERAVSQARVSTVPAVAFEDDPVAARRYGRAILDAALDALREAGRPLHAGEILERVVARGFTVPGRDPVAALNTRLWKRSGPGGTLRRLGDAVYALAEAPAA